MPQLQTSSALNICILVSIYILISRLSISLVIGIISWLPIPVPLPLSLWFWGILWVLLVLHLLWFRGLHHSILVTTCLVVWISNCGICTGSGDGMRSCSLGMGIRECSGIRVCCIRISTVHNFSIMEIHSI